MWLPEPGGRGNGELVFNGYRVSVGEESVLQLDGDAHGEGTKCH